MIETPLGVTRANEIAAAHETVSALVMGTSDLSRDLQANHTPDRTPLLYRCNYRTLFFSCCPVLLVFPKRADVFENTCCVYTAVIVSGRVLSS